MSPPAGFAAWCDFRGVSLVPAEWDAATHAEYRAWKLARFRAHVRHYARLGVWDLIRAQSGRARLIAILRDEAARAIEPAPAQIYGRSHGVHMLSARRDVGAQTPSVGPVLWGIYSRLDAP